MTLRNAVAALAALTAFAGRAETPEAPRKVPALTLDAPRADRADPPRIERTVAAPDPQKLQKADQALDKMKQSVRRVLTRLEEARTERDVVKLNCVNEKLVQMKALVKVSEQAEIALQEALARRDGAAETESAKIDLARLKVDQMRLDAEGCIGQLAFAVDQRTTVEIEQPKDLTERDLTRRDPPPPPVTRPPPASRFE